MKTVTIRELSRRTARIADAVENGETFELRRSGKVVGYLSRFAPAPERKPDWNAHFEWLRKQPKKYGGLLKEFEADRQRQRLRELAMGNLK
jgi:antitoxin (DNA-binding transcriptional repressor) of toxin-antitoxin stability system